MRIRKGLLYSSGLVVAAMHVQMSHQSMGYA